MATILSLPPEIDAKIVDLLPVASLKAYSLVCKAYLPLCRERLFARIRLFNSRFRLQDQIERMKQLLATSPPISELIKELQCDWSPLLVFDPVNMGGGTPQEHFNALQKFLQTTTNLQSFTFLGTPYRRFDWNTTGLRPQLTRIFGLPTLESLTIEWAENFLISDFLHCGPSLKKLYVGYFTMAPETLTVVGNTSAHSLQLTELTSGRGLTKYLATLCAPYTVGGNPILDLSLLSKCHIMLNESQEMEVARQALRRCSRLVDIHVTWCRYIPHALEFSATLLPFLSVLRHMKLQYESLPVDAGQDPLRGIGTELDNIRTVNVLETLTIDLEVSDYCSTGDSWGRLEEVLMKPGWPALQKVSLQLYLGDAVQKSTRFMKEIRDLPQTQFPRLSASELIMFDFCWIEE